MINDVVPANKKLVRSLSKDYISIYSDDRYTEANHKIEQKYHYIIKFVHEPKYTCSSCGFEIYTKSNNVTCENCNYKEYNEIPEHIISLCKDCSIDTEYIESIDNKKYDKVDVSKIRVFDMYGVLIYIIIYESDDKSSAPHDNYISYYFLFNSEENRDILYNTIIENNDLSIIEPTL
jgi:rubredoxin